MKKLLNTLYVTTPGTYLTREGETVLGKAGLMRLNSNCPFILYRLSCVSARPVPATPLLSLCAERKVSVSFFSYSGRYLARMVGPVSGNVLLRRAQYRKADDEAFTANIARNFVLAKIANCRAILLRAGRDQSAEPSASLKTAAEELRIHLLGLDAPMPLDSIRGQRGRRRPHLFQRLRPSNHGPERSFCFS